MSYKALLFCPDDKTARVVTQVLSELEFRVEPCNEPFAAVKKLMAEHFDAIVVDCENEQNAALLFKSAHNSGSNQTSLAVAVVEGQAGVAKAFRIGANLVLTKPINVEQSKGTLRVARGLLRKTDATKPATPPPVPRPAVTSTNTSTDTRRPFPAQTSEPQPAQVHLPAQPPPSPIPAASASVFDLEEEPAPKPEPAEAALLESMPDLLGNKKADPVSTAGTTKEYPWQPLAKPVAEPMATALRRAAEAAGRSETDFSATTKTPSSPTSAADAPLGHSHATSMASGQAAATAPAKELPKPESVEETPTRPLEAPAFSSLGGTSNEPAFGSGKKTILVAAAAVIAAIALGYVGLTKMHPVTTTPTAQKHTAQTVPVPVQPPTPAPVQPAASPTQDIAATPTSPQPADSASAPPVEQMPDITLSTTETRPPVSPEKHPPAQKKLTSIVAPNTVVRIPPAARAEAPMVVKNEAPTLAKPSQPPDEAAQPPAPGSLASDQTNDQAISGMMSTTAVSLPQHAQQVKVSQGVSQGLLTKRVEPVYPALAKQMRIQGAVELQANIGQDGSIKAVKLISGDSVLARSAIDAVKQWKYKPYYLDDQPVEIQTQVTVNFKLP
jgi:protein TonB